MSFTTIFHRKPYLLIVIPLLLTLSLGGCASSKPLLGTKPPALALSGVKATLLKAQRQNTAALAPLEMAQAKTALSQAEEIWNKHKGSSGSTGSPKRDDEIKEKALHAKLYAQIAQAISSQKKTEQQIATAEAERLKYESLKQQYQTEELQIKAIIAKQQQLEAERQAAEMRVQQETRAKEDAQKYARLAEAAKKDALLQMELAKQAKQEAQRQKDLAQRQRALAEASQQAALRAKEQAETAKQEALLEKQLAEASQQVALRAKEQAETAKQEALLEKQLAETARLKAQAETRAAKQHLQKLQKKLTLLSSEFAKVKEEKRGLVVTLSDILFDVDRATVRPGAAKNLTYLAQILSEYPNRKILIEGHTDSTGSAEHNQILSEERAFAVMGHLMSQGLDPQWMDAKGFGEIKPVSTNETAEGRQQNRRVDIIILNPDSSEI